MREKMTDGLIKKGYGNLILLSFFLLMSFCLGAAMSKFNIFPFGQGYAARLGLASMAQYLTQPAPTSTQPAPISTQPAPRRSVTLDYSSSNTCNSLNYDRRALHNFIEALRESEPGRSFIFGDSLIGEAGDLRVFGVNYIGVGISGLTIYCALSDIDFLINARPRNVILYLGGNDADGQSFYGASTAAIKYEMIVRRLIDSGVNVKIHGINLGHPSSRNRQYVEYLNTRLFQISQRFGLLYLNPIEDFNFWSNNYTQDVNVTPYNNLTYDGEHLKGGAYRIWFEEIARHIPGFR